MCSYTVTKFGQQIKKKKGQKQSEVFEIWFPRKIQKVRWLVKIKNLEVLKNVNEKRYLMKIISERKCIWIRHTIRNNKYLTMIIEGLVNGKSAWGRPRQKFITQIMEETEIN